MEEYKGMDKNIGTMMVQKEKTKRHQSECLTLSICFVIACITALTLAMIWSKTSNLNTYITNYDKCEQR